MSETAFVPLAREMDPYLLGEGGNCGANRVPHYQRCGVCFRENEEWHQEGCPADKMPHAWIAAERRALEA